MKQNEMIFENILQNDPTLNLYLRQVKAENDWHINLKFSALQIAINKFIEKISIYNYETFLEN